MSENSVRVTNRVLFCEKVVVCDMLLYDNCCGGGNCSCVDMRVLETMVVVEE